MEGSGKLNQLTQQSFKWNRLWEKAVKKFRAVASGFVVLAGAGIFLSASLVSVQSFADGPAPTPGSVDPHLHLCWVPGAGGGSYWAHTSLAKLEADRSVPLDFFDVGHGQTIQQLAQNLANILEQKLQADPDYNCHLVGYSMGGVVIRYAANFLTVLHPSQGRIALKQLLRSMTTVATPHRGTPLVSLLNTFLGEVDPGVDQIGMGTTPTTNTISQFDDVNSVTFAPQIANMPTYSYRSYLNSQSEAPSPVESLGYSGIQSYFAQQGITDEPDYRNDGIVPTHSQNFGSVLADIHAPHSFFGQDIGWTPSCLDLYEAHWHFLTQTLDTLDSKIKNRKAQSTGFLKALVPILRQATPPPVVKN